MASIPLPALNVKTPQMTNPLEMLSQLQQIRGQQQQLANAQQQNQQVAEAMRQSKVLNDAVQKFTDPQTGQTDHNGVMQYMAANGAGKDLIQYRTNLATLNKEQQSQEEQRIKTLTAKLGAGSQLVQAANDPDSWNQARMWVAKEMGPQYAQQMGDFSPENKQRAISAGMNSSQYADYALKLVQDQRAEEKHAAEMPGVQAKSNQQVKENAGTNAQGMTAAQQGEQKISRARLAMESRKIQLDYLNAGFTSDGQPMNAANASPTARQIASGKMDPATSRAMLRKQPGLYNQVLAVDPNFDEASIDKRFSFNKELTNYGQSHIGGQALALNKLVHHSDLLYDLVDGLDNGNFRPGNQLFNSVKTTFGNAPMPRFQAVRDFVVGEATKLAHGGVPNESDVKRAIDNMSSSNSPQQLKGAINEYLALSGGQMQAINEQGRQSGMGEGFTILGPEAKSIVQKHGIDQTTLKEAGKQAAPPKSGDSQTYQGHTYKFDGTQWVRQ